MLYAAGYRKFKVVNQAWVRRFTPTVTWSVGLQEKSWTFGGPSSGPFGEDIPGEWLSLDEAARRWLLFQTVKSADQTFTLDNWFDFHASL